MTATSWAGALLNYGDFLLSIGDFVRAEANCRDGLAIYQDLGYPLSSGACQFSIALSCLHQGRHQDALTLLHEALVVFRDFEYEVGVGSAFEGLAAVAISANGHEKAARLIGAAERLFERAGVTLEPTEHEMHERSMTAIRSDLGATRLVELKAEGRAMSIGDAIDYALHA